MAAEAVNRVSGERERKGLPRCGPVEALHRHGGVADGGHPAAEHGVPVGAAHGAVVGEGLADGAAVEAGVGGAAPSPPGRWGRGRMPNRTFGVSSVGTPGARGTLPPALPGARPAKAPLSLRPVPAGSGAPESVRPGRRALRREGRSGYGSLRAAGDGGRSFDTGDGE